MTEIVHHAGTFVAAVAAFAACWFVLSFGRTTWRRTEHGRLLMLLGSGFALIFTFVASRAVHGTRVEPLWLELIRLTVYAYGAGVMCWLVRLEHNDNHRRPE